MFHRLFYGYLMALVVGMTCCQVTAAAAAYHDAVVDEKTPIIDTDQTSTGAALGIFSSALISQSPTPTAITLTPGQTRICTLVYDNIGQENWLNTAGTNYVELRSVDSLGTTTRSSALAFNWLSATSVRTMASMVYAANGAPNPANSITFHWTAPGDDGNIGTAAFYSLHLNTVQGSLINWAALDSVTSMPTPQIAGTPQQKQVTGLLSNTSYYGAIKTNDEAGNTSDISNIVGFTTATTRTTLTFSIKAPATTGRQVLFVSLYNSSTGTFSGTPVKFVVQVPSGTFARVKYDFDGDRRADAWTRSSDGTLRIDYAANGFGGWDLQLPNYGTTLDQISIEDYDGDGKWDIGMLRNADRKFLIDYAANGFGSWDANFGGYGSSVDYVCSGDYDGDGLGDIAVRDADGDFHIDYAANGFGAWDLLGLGYGGPNDKPAPADYDGDKKCDFAIIRDSDRKFLIDYAANGLGAWDVTNLGGYGGYADLACPGDFDGDGKDDIAVLRVSDRKWLVDFAANGFGAWDRMDLGGYGGSGDRPAPSDYDGDGRVDIACYHTAQSQLCLDYANNTFGAWDYCDVTHTNLMARMAPVTEPLAFEVGPNQPNPFSTQTTIAYTLPFPSAVRLEVYDVAGQRVADVDAGVMSSGQHELVWRLTNQRSGVYFYRFTAAARTTMGRMVIVR